MLGSGLGAVHEPCYRGSMHMPIVDPRRYRDKTAVWTTDFLRRRAAELAPLVDAALLEEHRTDPRGQHTPHSAALKQVLDFIHNQPTDGKSFAYAATPYADYCVGVMHAREQAPSFPDETRYDSEREAVHAVFLERLRRFGLLPAATAGDRT